MAYGRGRKSGFRKARQTDTTPQQHAELVAQTKADAEAVGERRCPRDHSKLCADGHCRRCQFRLTICKPPTLSHRVPFNRVFQYAVGSRYATTK